MILYRTAAAPLFLILLVGCAPDLTHVGEPEPDEEPTANCILDYSVADGNGHESDNGLSITTVEARCLSAEGESCDSELYISRAAAECIAESAGLPDGIRAWDVHIDFHGEHGMPAWHLHSTTWDEGFEWGGLAVLLHAATGELLLESEWGDAQEEEEWG